MSAVPSFQGADPEGPQAACGKCRWLAPSCEEKSHWDLPLVGCTGVALGRCAVGLQGYLRHGENHLRDVGFNHFWAEINLAFSAKKILRRKNFREIRAVRRTRITSKLPS